MSKPVLATRAIVMHRGHVLLLRAVEPGREWFFLPGGMVKHGERMEDACAREVLEETGLSVHVRRALYCREFIAARHKRRSVHMPEQHHVVAMLYLCELPGDADTPFDSLGSFTPDRGAKGVTGLRWVSLRDIPAIEIMPPQLKAALMADFPPPADAGIVFWPED